MVKNIVIGVLIGALAGVSISLVRSRHDYRIMMGEFKQTDNELRHLERIQTKTVERCAEAWLLEPITEADKAFLRKGEEAVEQIRAIGRGQ